MNYHHSRRILTVDESSRKRKDRQDTFYSSSPRPSNPLTAVSNVSVTTSFVKPADLNPNPNNNSKMPNPILAGYMAYEFLTKGTLMGQKFDPARANSDALAEPMKKRKSSPEEEEEEEEGELGKIGKSKPKTKEGSYAELACLLRSDGTHIPGIVNPTQLAQWIQM